MKAENYHTLTLAEVKDFYFQQQPLPEKSVLTFDDCYQSMKEYAYPLLKEAGFKATAFVVTGWFLMPSALRARSFADIERLRISRNERCLRVCQPYRSFSRTQGPARAFNGKHQQPLRKTYEAAISTWPSRMFCHPLVFMIRRRSLPWKGRFCSSIYHQTRYQHGTNQAKELHRAVIPFSLPMAAFEQRFRNEEMNQ